MTAPDESLIEKIRKLLALAGNNPNENESSAAMAKANELLLKHNLSMSSIVAGRKSDKPRVQHKGLSVAGNFNWRKLLLIAIARANLCEALISGHIVFLVGTPENTEIVELLYHWIDPQMDKLAKIAATAYIPISAINPKTGRPGAPVSKQRFRNNYLHGMVTRVHHRLQDSMTKTIDANESMTAMVLVTGAEVKAYVQDQFRPRPMKIAQAQGAGKVGEYEGFVDGAKVSIAIQEQLSA